MKRILVLGGGKNQLPLIKAAKAEGYHVILCDCYNDSVGVGYCDTFYQVSTGDREKVFDIALHENIDGVVGNTEAIMHNVAYISQKFNLVGNTEESVRNLISKSQFRQIQYELGLFAPKCYESNDIDEAINKIKKYKFPIIVKPAESSGSRGTTIIEDRNDIEGISSAFCTCKEFSRNGFVIFEEFVDMNTFDEVEAEIFVHNGEILWDGLLLTLRNENLPLIPMTDIYPLPYSNEQIDRIKQVLTLLINKAGITHGEYNAELYFTPNNDIFVMEINARQGGDSIPYYVCKSTGIDMYKLLVTTSVGDDKYWNSLECYKREIKYVVHHPLFTSDTGIFDGLFVDDSIKQYVDKTYLSKNIGDKLHPAKNATDELGFVDFIFPTKEEQLSTTRVINKLVKVIVK